MSLRDILTTHTSFALKIDLFGKLVSSQVSESKTAEIARFYTRISKYPVLKLKFPNRSNAILL